MSRDTKPYLYFTKLASPNTWNLCTIPSVLLGLLNAANNLAVQEFELFYQNTVLNVEHVSPTASPPAQAQTPVINTSTSTNCLFYGVLVGYVLCIYLSKYIKKHTRRSIVAFVWVDIVFIAFYMVCFVYLCHLYPFWYYPARFFLGVIQSCFGFAFSLAIDLLYYTTPNPSLSERKREDLQIKNRQQIVFAGACQTISGSLAILLVQLVEMIGFVYPGSCIYIIVLALVMVMMFCPGYFQFLKGRLLRAEKRKMEAENAQTEASFVSLASLEYLEAPSAPQTLATLTLTLTPAPAPAPSPLAVSNRSEPTTTQTLQLLGKLALWGAIFFGTGVDAILYRRDVFFKSATSVAFYMLSFGPLVGSLLYLPLQSVITPLKLILCGCVACAVPAFGICLGVVVPYLASVRELSLGLLVAMFTATFANVLGVLPLLISNGPVKPFVFAAYGLYLQLVKIFWVEVFPRLFLLSPDHPFALSIILLALGFSMVIFRAKG
ncbi:hypothetical protein NEDG_01212 [Nematocida displodere]|uniref:Uncharacterized protein n=1 Tax=Nematocida displodere TaxID=1805483 RepID=A0A177EAV1_9MICR|nr:hypothetical protein NEDG_01212 [Nematocida displodere]